MKRVAALAAAALVMFAAACTETLPAAKHPAIPPAEEPWIAVDTAPHGAEPAAVQGDLPTPQAAAMVLPSSLGIDETIREGLQANRDLRAAYFAIDEARGRLLQAGLWPNPQLRFSGAHDFAFANDGAYSTSTGFEQRFPVTGRIARARDVARVDVAIAVAEVRDVTRRFIGDVQTAFYDLLSLQEQIAVRDRLLGIDRTLVEVSQARAKRAEVSALDVNSARIELERLELERTLLVTQSRARTAELNKLLGRAPEAPLTVHGEIRLPPMPSRESLREQALRLRPDRQQAALEQDRAHADLQLAKAERWEDWAIGFSYDRDRAVINGAPSQPSDQFLGLGLTIPIPLWNQNQGRIAETRASEAQAKDRLAALELTIFAEIESAHVRGDDLARIVENYRGSVIPLSDRNVSLAQEAYRSGLATVTQVVQVQRQQSELQTSYLDALSQYRRAWIDLEVAAATNQFLDEVKP